MKKENLKAGYLTPSPTKSHLLSHYEYLKKSLENGADLELNPDLYDVKENFDFLIFAGGEFEILQATVEYLSDFDVRLPIIYLGVSDELDIVKEIAKRNKVNLTYIPEKDMSGVDVVDGLDSTIPFDSVLVAIGGIIANISNQQA